MISFVNKYAPAWVIGLLKRVRGLLRGRWPLALAMRSLKKSSHEQSLTGKILYKMAYDRNPKLTLFADKVLVRQYVRSKVGEKYLAAEIATLDNPEELRGLHLPENFALKSNHGSGGMILVWDGADRGIRLPESPRRPNWSQFLIHSDDWDQESAIRLARVWFEQNYFYRIGQFPEWGYKKIKPRLLIEEILTNSKDELPEDYKFFVANGRCQFVQVDTSRFQNHCRDIYTPEWAHVPVENIYPNSGQILKKPDALEEMIKIAEVLGEDTDFIRVDLYNTSKGVKFGELTNYPGGGVEPYSPAVFDRLLCQDWEPRYPSES